METHLGDNGHFLVFIKNGRRSTSNPSQLFHEMRVQREEMLNAVPADIDLTGNLLSTSTESIGVLKSDVSGLNDRLSLLVNRRTNVLGWVS